MKNEIIAIIGLGYVGLPLAVEFGKKIKTIGYDIDRKRIEELKKKYDKTKEIQKKQFQLANKLSLTSNKENLIDATVFIITVPTPVDNKNNPDLKLLKRALKTTAQFLGKNSLVIIESTVYPGLTEEFCVPILEKFSRLKYNRDFFCGYSPERINPGDKKRTLTKIKKVVSGSNKKTTKRVNYIYKKIIKAGTYIAVSIKVAETAKVIENTQRDINIAFMNEVAIICNKLNINTNDVINTAKTKWNFLNFVPGLVGGHCISVDPYYLFSKSKEVGYEPKIILSGRKINNQMSKYVTSELLKKIKQNMVLRRPRVLIMGVTFKEDCPDVRNSQVVKIVNILKNKNIGIHVYDDIADKELLKKEFNIRLISKPKKNYYDAVMIAVKHKSFYSLGIKKIRSMCNKKGFIYDLKYTFSGKEVEMSL
tara:strand:+ start:1341 stop:2606 length:1266 start_codon:yes stop_codon:yes gene_type:complete